MKITFLKSDHFSQNFFYYSVSFQRLKKLLPYDFLNFLTNTHSFLTLTQFENLR